MKSLKLVISRDADFMELNSGGHQANQDIARRPEVWEYDLDKQKQEPVPVEEDPVADAVDQDERDTDDNLQEEFESAQEITGAVVYSLRGEPRSYTEATDKQT